jgi:hypothetical protein
MAMMGKKTKIVLDADVIVHFAKGGKLDMLPRILPEYQFMVLDVVKKEIPVLVLSVLQKCISQDKTIVEEVFGKTPGEIREFARLIAKEGMALGRGESACMVYCLYHHDVVGSSNTKDVTAYCEENGITYLTTCDFLYYAIKRGLMTKEEAEVFICEVRRMGSFPPIVDFDRYVCSKL